MGGASAIVGAVMLLTGALDTDDFTSDEVIDAAERELVVDRALHRARRCGHRRAAAGDQSMAHVDAPGVGGRPWPLGCSRLILN